MFHLKRSLTVPTACHLLPKLVSVAGKPTETNPERGKAGKPTSNFCRANRAPQSRPRTTERGRIGHPRPGWKNKGFFASRQGAQLENCQSLQSGQPIWPDFPVRWPDWPDSQIGKTSPFSLSTLAHLRHRHHFLLPNSKFMPSLRASLRSKSPSPS